MLVKRGFFAPQGVSRLSGAQVLSRNLLYLFSSDAGPRAVTNARFPSNLFPSTIANFQSEHFNHLFPPEALGGTYYIEISEQQILGDPSYLVPMVNELGAGVESTARSAALYAFRPGAAG